MSKASKGNQDLYEQLEAALGKADATAFLKNMEAQIRKETERDMGEKLRKQNEPLEQLLAESDIQFQEKDAENKRLTTRVQSQDGEIKRLREERTAQQPAQASFPITQQSNTDKKRIAELETQLAEAQATNVSAAPAQTDQQVSARENALLERIAAQDKLIGQQSASLQQSDKEKAVLKAKVVQANRSVMDMRDELEASKKPVAVERQDSGIRSSLEDELRTSLQDEVATQFVEKSKVIASLKQAVDVTQNLVTAHTPENQQAATKFAEEATALLEEQRQKNTELQTRMEALDKKYNAVKDLQVITVGAVAKKPSLFQRLFGKKQKEAPAPDKQYLVDPKASEQAAEAAPKKGSWLSRVFSKKDKAKGQEVVAIKGKESVDSFVGRLAQEQPGQGVGKGQ